MPTVLLVDDEPLILMSAAETLREAGYDVFEAADARKALAHIREHGEVDALVTDVRMPGSIDGLALAGIVSRCWPDTALAICSGHACRHEAEAYGHFLPKPYMPAQLVAIVEAALAKGRLPNPHAKIGASLTPSQPVLESATS